MVFTVRKGFLAVLVGLIFATPSGGASIGITVAERGGANRVGECVRFGVPIPRAWKLTDAGKLRLLAAGGKPVAAQFTPLARWAAGPDDAAAPIKWVLVEYLQTLPAGGTAKLTLDAGGPAPPRRSPGPAPAATLRVDTKTPGKLIVDTGAARFELNTKADFNLLNQVTVQGRSLLEPLSATQAIRYRPAGKLSIVAGGKPHFKPRTTAVRLERVGPLSAVVKAAGSILDAPNRALLDFTARLYFAAGRSDVRVDLTVENNHPVMEGDTGQPTNAHYQGAVNSVYVGSLAMRFRLAAGAGPLTVLTERQVRVANPTSAVRLYQDSSGTKTWNAYVGPVGWPKEKAPAAPRLQSFCTRKGFTVTGSGLGAGRTGEQALGWMTLARGPAARAKPLRRGGDPAPGARLTACVRDFWQNFPKALQADRDGTLSVDLFPNGDRFKHNLRVGEQKTHSVRLHFNVGPARAGEGERLAKAFARPLFGLAEGGHYIRSGVLGEVPAMNLARWPLYERYVRIAFEPNPDFDPSKDDPNHGNRTLREAVKRFNLYGWQDYGDVPLDYEAFGPNQAGQMNLKYWFLYGMLVQLARSGEPRWLDLALPAARHLSDLDILHIPDSGIRHWAHGAYFGHSQHNEPGNRNPNRNSNSPSVDLFYGPGDLMLAYCLTGERRFREVALEGLAAMKNLSQFSNFQSPLFERERANLIFAYIEGFRYTGDKQWLTELRKVVASVADLSNKPWVTDPAGYGKKNPGHLMRMFMFSQVVWTLGRYLDFCKEYGLADDLKVAKALGAYGDFVLKSAMKEYRPGRAAVPYDVVFDGSDKSQLDINNWALVTADALAYAYKYTGQRKYLDAAAKFYATGTIDPVWKDDPPVYLSTKDLTNSLNWGLVYMNQQAAKAKTPAK